MCNSTSVISECVFLLFSPVDRQSKQWPGVVENDKLSVVLAAYFAWNEELATVPAIEERNSLVGQLLVGREGSPAPGHAGAILSDVPQQQ